MCIDTHIYILGIRGLTRRYVNSALKKGLLDHPCAHICYHFKGVVKQSELHLQKSHYSFVSTCPGLSFCMFNHFIFNMGLLVCPEKDTNFNIKVLTTIFTGCIYRFFGGEGGTTEICK